MNNSKAPKIVVGVGLAAIYATGLAFLMQRGGHATVVARNAPDVPTVEAATEPVAPPAIASAFADASTSVAEAPAAVTAPPEPAVTTAARGKEKTIASRPAAPPALMSNVGKSAPASLDTSTGNGPAASADDAPASAQAGSESPGNDSQVTPEAATQPAQVGDVDASAPTVNN